jgi:hypothetical protein
MLGEEEYQQWNARYQAARTSMVDRAAKMAAVAEEIEVTPSAPTRLRNIGFTQQQIHEDAQTRSLTLVFRPFASTVVRTGRHRFLHL